MGNYHKNLLDGWENTIKLFLATYATNQPALQMFGKEITGRI